MAGIEQVSRVCVCGGVWYVYACGLAICSLSGVVLIELPQFAGRVVAAHAL